MALSEALWFSVFVIQTFSITTFALSVVVAMPGRHATDRALFRFR